MSETSGDSLEDDGELFNEDRDYEKVKISLSTVPWWFCRYLPPTAIFRRFAQKTLDTVNDNNPLGRGAQNNI